MNSPQGIRGSVILNLSFNIHVDKRKKQKHPQIAQQFWVLACYELPYRNTRQRNPEPSVNMDQDQNLGTRHKFGLI
jgi:hypothetical protein